MSHSFHWIRKFCMSHNLGILKLFLHWKRQFNLFTNNFLVYLCSKAINKVILVFSMSCICRNLFFILLLFCQQLDLIQLLSFVSTCPHHIFDRISPSTANCYWHNAILTVFMHQHRTPPAKGNFSSIPICTLALQSLLLHIPYSRSSLFAFFSSFLNVDGSWHPRWFSPVALLLWSLSYCSPAPFPHPSSFCRDVASNKKC